MSLRVSIFRIGRDPEANLVLHDYSISREHAAITGDNGGFRLRDLASSNGTFLNGRRLVSLAVSLTDGDSVRFGGVSFHFQEERRSLFRMHIAQMQRAHGCTVIQLSDLQRTKIRSHSLATCEPRPSCRSNSGRFSESQFVLDSGKRSC